MSLLPKGRRTDAHDRLDNASSIFQQPLPVVAIDESIMTLNTGPCLISISARGSGFL